MTQHKRYMASGKIAMYAENTKSLFIGAEYAGSFGSVAEAFAFCDSADESYEISESIVVDTPKQSRAQVALAIQESGDMRPTESLVEGFMYMVENKKFLPLSTLLSLRESAKNNPIPGKVDYVMQDGSVVAIDFETNVRLNKSIDINESPDLVREMTSSSASFLRIAGQILKD